MINDRRDAKASRRPGSSNSPKTKAALLAGRFLRLGKFWHRHGAPEGTGKEEGINKKAGRVCDPPFRNLQESHLNISLQT